MKRIFELGKNCRVWKTDLSRAFRICPLCPRDFLLAGMRWRNKLFFDKVMPMGLRSVAYICQCITNAITYIHHNMGFWVINYLDDFGNAEKEDKAWDSYVTLGNILQSIGATEAVEKLVSPCTHMEFLGNTVDTVSMTLEVSQVCKQELLDELRKWQHKSWARKKDMQSLIGKLSFVMNCMRAGRIFLSRMIDTIKGNEHNSVILEVDKEFKKDVQWWSDFLPNFDGISLIWLNDTGDTDNFLATDASLQGGGAVCGDEFFHHNFDEYTLARATNIAQLEMLTLCMAIKMWAEKM